MDNTIKPGRSQNPFALSDKIGFVPEPALADKKESGAPDQTSAKTEGAPTAETLTTLASDLNQENPNSPATQPKTQGIPNVVNKATEKEPLHTIAKGDSLTKFADDEEKEFIEKVETAHGTN